MRRGRPNRFIITGSPRSGTRYISALLRTLGVKAGHEDVFHVREACGGGAPAWEDYDGDCSWLAAPLLPIEDVVVIHQVRDPLAVVRSLAAQPVMSDEGTHFSKVIRKHAPDVFEPNSMAERAARMWCTWNSLAEAHAVFTYRIEDMDEDLVLRLAGTLGLSWSREAVRQVLAWLPEQVNRRDRDETVAWESIEPTVGDLAARYGYRRAGRFSS